MSLRSDLHEVFDEGVFAIVPKRDVEEEAYWLVTHIFSPHDDMSFNQTFHNRRIAMDIHGTECLFARFA